MELLGIYQTRLVYWFDYNKYQLEELPIKGWLCIAISDTKPNDQKFENFVRYSIVRGIFEFKGFGQLGEMLHDIFDEIMIAMEVIENHDPISVVTTWHDEETIEDTLRECLFTPCLHEKADMSNISIVVTDLNGNNRSTEIKGILERLEI
jgi:hypothetical protein